MVTYLANLLCALYLAIGLIFLVGSLSKLRHLERLAQSVSAVTGMAQERARYLAAPVVVLELGVGLAVLAHRQLLGVSIAAGSLLIAYALAMAIALLRGIRDVDCSCFGGLLEQRVEWRMVCRNIALAAAALLVNFCNVDLLKIQWQTVALPALAFALFYFVINTLWALDVSRRQAFGGFPS